ncbi:MAG: hypothetical protein QF632_01635 [Candidatus Woesearchaeota archaeon]|jgi:hypothetical protein|nr:hypothetical protein [Candidatus Woesearchaeota archaeon]MDP7323444.1 hypothetical protein [Candidatus Woesearchaeota archaeon]MDP7458254.1 hypothetical protein [Candidatus Woesearchaeota archaeon]|tara:strand:- start:324 stop:524 length:201 start_codon:yes stop_codon:yes gene_type:complete
MAETVTISKKEYDLLRKCKHIVDSEFQGNFSEKFIKDVRESEEDYKNGNFVRVKNSAHRKKIFDAL